MTTKVVSQMTPKGVALANSCTPMNWAEPAKTMADMACASSGGSPAATASTP